MNQLALTFGPAPRPPKHRAYYDTTPIPLAELSAAVARAEHQDDQVLAVFRVHRRLAPSRCAELVASSGRWTLLTSVRRSIASLTKAGALRKTAELVDGPHGSAEHLWELHRAGSAGA